MNKQIELYFDGACTDNKRDGDLGLGYHAQYKGDPLGAIFKESKSAGIGTANEAEYQALIHGLLKLIKMNLTGPIKIIGDSEVVINQMKGKYSARKYELVKLKKYVEKLLEKFEEFEFIHVKRENNQLADELSKEGIKRTMIDYYNYKF